MADFDVETTKFVNERTVRTPEGEAFARTIVTVHAHRAMMTASFMDVSAAVPPEL